MPFRRPGSGALPLFMAHGGSHVTLAKGNRSRQVTDACKKHGRVLPRLYRRAGGDPCPRVHKEVGAIEYEELGMEAIFRVDVENFPAFIVVDDKGNDFFSQLS